MKYAEYVLNHKSEVLEFLKRRYPLYHLSNVFLRDIQYGIGQLLKEKGWNADYDEVEAAANEFIGKMVTEKIFDPVDQQTWVLHYPEFKKPSVAPAKPAGPAAKPPIAPAKPGPASGTKGENSAIA